MKAKKLALLSVMDASIPPIIFTPDSRQHFERSGVSDGSFNTIEGAGNQFEGHAMFTGIRTL